MRAHDCDARSFGGAVAVGEEVLLRVLLGWLRHRSGSMGPGVIVHALANVAAGFRAAFRSPPRSDTKNVGASCARCPDISIWGG